jgi:hypothetical protein
LNVDLYDGKGGHRNIYVHRLVAAALIPNPKHLPQVNHIDANKQNNRVENLEWCTNRRNREHAVGMKMGVGDAMPNAILTEAIVREIKREYPRRRSRVYFAKRFGVSVNAVRNVVRGRTWKWVA